MADISKITLPSGTTYDIKDATARQAIAGGVSYLGVSSTAITDGGTEKPTIGGNVITPDNGNLVIYNSAEFIYSGTYGSNGEWAEFGDMSTLGDLAYKDSASGTVAVPSTYTTTVTPSTVSKYVAASASGGGTASKGTVTVSPASSGTATYTPAGTIGTGTGTANYTPGGSVGTPTITVTPSTVTKYVAASSSGGGSVTAGSAASCTLPVLTTSVSNETLTIGWSAGSFTANTPTAVTLPSFSSQTIATGISSATSSQPSFTGTGVELKFTGTGARLKTDSEVYTTVTMPSFSSQTIATGISSATTTTATTENKTVTVT